MSPENNARIKIPIFMKFILGGVSGASATTIIYPFQIIYNLIDKNNKNYIKYIRTSIRNKTPLILYRAQLIHNTVHSSIRIGVYSSLQDSYISKYKEQPTFSWRIAMGTIASTLSSLIGAPTDAIYTIINESNNVYIKKKNIMNIVANRIRQKGIISLLRFNSGKYTASNMVQLASYAQSKHHLQDYFQMKDDINLYIVASTISSIAKAFTYIPLKYIELRFQNVQFCTKYPAYLFFFQNSSDYLLRIYIRQFSWSVAYTAVTFILLEKFANVYAENVLGNKSKGSVL